MTTDPELFVRFFRDSSPYILAHRGRTCVIVFAGEVLEGPGVRDLVHDVALLHGLGLRLVLVCGLRPQIERRLSARGERSRYVDGIRVTDDAALACVQEAAGTVRVQLEARLSMGLPSSPMAGARLRVAAGNFVIARPLGVIDGVDFQHSGAVRRVDAEAMKQRLDDGAIVLLTPVGYSSTGETFNVGAHEVAAAAAVGLGADKLVSLVEGSARLPAELTSTEARALLARRPRMAEDVRRHLSAAADACSRGVRRAHLLSRRIDGGLLLELFTRDGVGTLVTDERFEGLRPATLGDVGGILALIEPLEQEGVLVARSRETLEADAGRFTVIERDGMVVACAALYEHPAHRMAELACVAVHPDYRDAQRGEQLLAWIERRCRERGITKLFVLTTQSAHWFVERGFTPGRPKDLPRGRKYSRRRRSKVLLKAL